MAGTMVSGTINVNDTLLLGPDTIGLFTPVQIKSIHTRRVPVKSVTAGQTASFALKKIKRSFIRKVTAEYIVFFSSGERIFSCSQAEA